MRTFEEHLERAQKAAQFSETQDEWVIFPPKYKTLSVSPEFDWPMAAKCSEPLVDSYRRVYALPYEVTSRYRQALQQSVDDFLSEQAEENVNVTTVEVNGTASNDTDRETEKGTALAGTESANVSKAGRDITRTPMDEVGIETEKWRRLEIKSMKRMAKYERERKRRDSRRRRRGELDSGDLSTIRNATETQADKSKAKTEQEVTRRERADRRNRKARRVARLVESGHSRQRSGQRSQVTISWPSDLPPPLINLSFSECRYS